MNQKRTRARISPGDQARRSTTSSRGTCLTCTSTCTMQISTSKVHWVGAECSDHALISCTVGADLLTYRKDQVVGGRPGELKLKKIDPKQLTRIQSKLNVITSPIAQETRRSYTADECNAEQAMVQMIAVRVTTARQLMHENPEGRSSGTRPPQKPRTSQDLEGH